MNFRQALAKFLKRAIDFFVGQETAAQNIPPPLERGTMREAIHECGHFAISYLHNSTFQIREITINKERARQVNPTYNGGLRVRFIRQPDPKEVDPAEKLSQVALGGICAATIYRHGPDFVRENRHTFPSDATALDGDGADVDYEMANFFMGQLANKFNVDPPITTLWSVFRFDFEFLLDQNVWQCVTSLATELHNKENQTMSPQELIRFVTDNGFADYMATIRPQLIARRYPINAAKLTLI